MVDVLPKIRHTHSTYDIAESDIHRMLNSEMEKPNHYCFKLYVATNIFLQLNIRVTPG